MTGIARLEDQMRSELFDTVRVFICYALVVLTYLESALLLQDGDWEFEHGLELAFGQGPTISLRDSRNGIKLGRTNMKSALLGSR